MASMSGMRAKYIASVFAAAMIACGPLLFTFVPQGPVAVQGVHAGADRAASPARHGGRREAEGAGVQAAADAGIGQGTNGSQRAGIGLVLCGLMLRRT